MDFRQYDQALGRFNVMDIFSEMAYDHTPYRYGFNNPVFWQDKMGLFETDALARTYAFVLGISANDYYVTNNTNGGYNLVVTGGQFEGTTFYDYSELLDTVEIKSKGGGSNGSSSNKSNSKFWKFWETGGMFQVWGVMKESLGFKKNSRKRSPVDASINYDQAINPSVSSVTKGKEWMKRLKDWLNGAETRTNSLLPNNGSNRTEGEVIKPVTKEEREIITIQIKVYSPEKLFEDTGKAKVHSRYNLDIYRDQEARYRQLERADSIRNTEKRWK